MNKSKTKIFLLKMSDRTYLFAISSCTCIFNYGQLGCLLKKRCLVRRALVKFHNGCFFMENVYHKELESSILERRHYELNQPIGHLLHFFRKLICNGLLSAEAYSEPNRTSMIFESHEYFSQKAPSSMFDKLLQGNVCDEDYYQ